jgi:hypothetical protein
VAVSNTAELREWADTASAWQLFLLVAGPLFLLFLLTSNRAVPYHIDAFSNVLPAWSLATSGSVYLPDHEVLVEPEYFGNIAWLVPAQDTVASKYPPGAALVAAPLYAVWPQDAEIWTVRGFNRPEAAPVEIPVPSFWPAAIASSLSVALAMGFLALSFRPLADGATALAGAYMLGLGTSAWSVAANELWQHGPGMMWIALAGALAARNLVAAGFSYGMAVLTRPLNAFIAGATGLYVAWQKRSLWPAVQVGVGALAGLAALVAFNAAAFGEPSVLGGYAPVFVDNAQSLDVVGYGRNIVLALFSPTRGLLVWSPFLLVLVPGLVAGWRAAPGWARGAAIGAVAYLLFQYKANRFTGGAGFATYRYPLEALVAAAPVLVLSYTQWVAKRPTAVRVFRVLAVVAVAAHGAFAVIY